MGYRILSLPGTVVRASPHPGGEEGLWKGRVPAGPRAGVRVLLFPQLSAAGRAAGRGQGPQSAQSRAGRATGPWPGWEPGGAERGGGHLPSSSTFFPAGSLDRERVETSLRMQDLTGSKAHAEAGGRGRSAGGMDTASARLRGRCPERSGLGPAPSSGGRGSRGVRGTGSASGDPGRGGVVTKGSARPRRRPLRRRRCPMLARWPRSRPCKSRLIPAEKSRRS